MRGTGTRLKMTKETIKQFIGPAFLVWVWLRADRLTADPTPAPRPIVTQDVSFRNEIGRAIGRGLAWLKTNQDAAGHWSTPEQPAVTALALMAFAGEPSGRFQQERPPWIEKGYAFIMRCAQGNGGIYREKLPNYNTAI